MGLSNNYFLFLMTCLLAITACSDKKSPPKASCEVVKVSENKLGAVNCKFKLLDAAKFVYHFSCEVNDQVDKQQQIKQLAVQKTALSDYLGQVDQALNSKSQICHNSRKDLEGKQQSVQKHLKAKLAFAASLVVSDKLAAHVPAYEAANGKPTPVMSITLEGAQRTKRHSTNLIQAGRRPNPGNVSFANEDELKKLVKAQFQVAIKEIRNIKFNITRLMSFVQTQVLGEELLIKNKNMQFAGSTFEEIIGVTKARLTLALKVFAMLSQVNPDISKAKKLTQKIQNLAKNSPTEKKLEEILAEVTAPEKTKLTDRERLSIFLIINGITDLIGPADSLASNMVALVESYEKIYELEAMAKSKPKEICEYYNKNKKKLTDQIFLVTFFTDNNDELIENAEKAYTEFVTCEEEKTGALLNKANIGKTFAAYVDLYIHLIEHIIEYSQEHYRKMLLNQDKLMGEFI